MSSCRTACCAGATSPRRDVAGGVGDQGAAHGRGPDHRSLPQVRPLHRPVRGTGMRACMPLFMSLVLWTVLSFAAALRLFRWR